MRRSRRRGELFAARGGAAPPRGLSIEVLLYLGRRWLLGCWLAPCLKPLEAWAHGAESAPRRVQRQGLLLRSRLSV